MKIRNITNMPLLFEETLEFLGRVEKAVIGDDYRLLYLVVQLDDGKHCMISRDDFCLTLEAVKIRNLDCMKSYLHGEELSIYEKKIGDRVYNSDGRELGIVSDFVINPDEGVVHSIEVSSGTISDWLNGRLEVPLEQIRWASPENLVANNEGSEKF